jgi:hypothetical protein
VVVGFAVVRIGVAPGEALDGLAEMSFRQIKLTTAQMPETERVVAARVQRIAAQRLAPIKRRTARGVTILLQVQSGDVKLVGAGDVLWRRRFGCGRRHFAFGGRLELVRNDLVAGAVGDAQQQMGCDNAARKFDFLEPGLAGRQVAGEARQRCWRGGVRRIPAIFVVGGRNNVH